MTNIANDSSEARSFQRVRQDYQVVILYQCTTWMQSKMLTWLHFHLAASFSLR